LPYISRTISELDGWQRYEATFTIPPGYIYQTGTNGVKYFCMRQFKIGYYYTTTDQYGTKLFINNLVIEKISAANSFK